MPAVAGPPATGEPPAAAGPPAVQPARDDREAAIASVAENLRFILNTKEGYGWFLPGFGLGHYFASPTGGASPAARPTLIAEIEANVRQFEPRLVDPVLTLVGRDASWIVFRLNGRIAGRPVALGIQLNASFGAVRIARIEVQDDGRG